MAHRRRIVPLGLAVASLALAAPPAGAAVISTPGSPLPNIWIDKRLQCQIERATWPARAFVQLGTPAPNAACGTFITRETAPRRTYGPNKLLPFLKATPPKSQWKPVFQKPYTRPGGTHCILTRVRAGKVVVDEADCYAQGANFYTTRIAARNLDPQNKVDVTIYHAAACQLKGSTAGFGAYDAAGYGIYCTDPGSPTVTATSSEGFINAKPTNSALPPWPTPAFNYVQNERFAVGMWIGNSGINGCLGCSTLNDNAIGLSWFVSLLPGQPNITRAMRSRFAN